MIIEERAAFSKERKNIFAKDLNLSLLLNGDCIYLNARGRSMYPFIKDGDIIKIAPIKKRPIRMGDIVAVDKKTEGDGWFLVHRVVKILEDSGREFYLTKGDAHKGSPEGPFAIDIIAGRVAQIERSHLRIDLETPVWRLLNKIIARVSLRYPQALHLLSGYISLIIEWRLFPLKLKKMLIGENILLRNTEELVLLSARNRLGQAQKERAMVLIKEGVSWEKLAVLAANSGIAVLCYKSLASIAPYGYIPQSVFQALKPVYLSTLSRAALQHRELIDILRVFDKEGIAASALKGTFLSRRLYGDIAIRGLSLDLDLLIKLEDREKARRILLEKGYEFSGEREIEEWLWQEEYTRSGLCNIDIIYDIWLRGYNKEAISGIWQGTDKVIIPEGTAYYELHNEELLIYLVTHLVTSDNGYKCLKYICDIGEFLSLHYDTLKWDSLVNKAKIWRLASSLYAALVLTEDLFSVSVPASVINGVRPSFLKRSLIALFFNKRVLLRNNFRRKLMGRFLRDVFFELIEARSFKQYYAVFMRTFFPPKPLLKGRSYISRILKGLLRIPF